jgi:hypothetical protein
VDNETVDRQFDALRQQAQQTASQIAALAGQAVYVAAVRKPSSPNVEAQSATNV